MIDTLTFQNLNSVSLALNTDIYPLNLYETEIGTRMEDRSKSGQDGMWATFTYEDGMDIEMEGAILADDSDDYFTKRKALVDCIRYKPAVRQRRTGVLYVTFDNAAEQYKVDVSLKSFSAPRAGASPNYTTFRLVLFSFVPYYVGVGSGDHYYDE